MPTTPNPDAPDGLIRNQLPYRVEGWEYDPDTSRSLWRALGAFGTLADAKQYGRTLHVPYGRLRAYGQTLRYWEHPDLNHESVKDETPVLEHVATRSENRAFLQALHEDL